MPQADQPALVKLAADGSSLPSPSAPLSSTLLTSPIAAKTFHEAYYPALESNSPTLPSFYVPEAPIVWNGNALAGGAAFATFWAKMPKCRFEVQSYDAQPTKADGRGSCSFVLIVSGSVKVGDMAPDIKERGFSETFMLKPNVKDPTRFLVATQGFRYVM